MLTRMFNDRFQQVMRSRLEELKEESSIEFSEADADATDAGRYPPLLRPGLRSQVAIHLVKKIIIVAVGLQTELISELQIPFSDTLAGELKDQVKAYVSNERCEDLRKININGISEQHASRLKEELYVNRSFFLKGPTLILICL